MGLIQYFTLAISRRVHCNNFTEAGAILSFSEVGAMLWFYCGQYVSLIGADTMLYRGGCNNKVLPERVQ